jgi:hypothetical protein
MTFDEILIEEPRLAAILKNCFDASHLPSDNLREKMWYKIFKKQMSELVGNYADNPKLATPEVYDLVYQTMIKLLRV